MTECEMNHNGLCGLQSAGNLPFKCNGTETCPIFRKMLALEQIAFPTGKFNYFTNDEYEYKFTGSN